MRTKPLTPLWLPRTVDPQTSPTTRSSASYWRCTAAGSEQAVMQRGPWTAPMGLWISLPSVGNVEGTGGQQLTVRWHE